MNLTSFPWTKLLSNRLTFLQTLVVTKQSPNGTLVAASGLPITMIGNKRPLAASSTSIPSVVPVITAISNYQNGPQEQHQIQIQVGIPTKKHQKTLAETLFLLSYNPSTLSVTTIPFYCSLLDEEVVNLANELQPFTVKKLNVYRLLFTICNVQENIFSLISPMTFYQENYCRNLSGIHLLNYCQS